MPVGLAPDIVHVVPDMPLSATYRPTVSALRAAGVPKASRNSWYLERRYGEVQALDGCGTCSRCPVLRTELSAQVAPRC